MLDLFCGAGGAAMGYHRAGFEVFGVDINPQPNYPFRLIEADAIAVLRDIVEHSRFMLSRRFGFAAIHASPPCQAFTDYRRKGYGVGDGYPNLIPETRELLEATGLPYVIENVEKARPELRDPVLLCGSMFGLDVRRHRLFETNWPLLRAACDHGAQRTKGKRFPGATNRDGRYTCEVGVWRIPLPVQQAAMGMDWSTLEELSEAVPPAYTEHIGHQLLDFVTTQEVERAA
jgi:DNA (cytosine-5)-methyltransferase 1